MHTTRSRSNSTVATEYSCMHNRVMYVLCILWISRTSTNLEYAYLLKLLASIIATL